MTSRNIGTAGIECFKGPCDPWSIDNCAICPIRPMKIYTGNNKNPMDWALCHEKGYGILHPAEYRQKSFPYHALDNGAFPAWRDGRSWSPEPFLNALSKFELRGPALDFVVVPDKVALGNESLEFSLAWVGRIDTEARKYLAVQDGMTPIRVKRILYRFGGIFVGGTMSWKLNTSPQWIGLAHSQRKPCHIGRVGTWDRIVWASSIGADSIDSTSWARNNSYHHLENAQAQTLIEDQGA